MTRDKEPGTDRWQQQVEEIFHAALERAPHERASFLARACDSDSELRAEIESLLAAHEQSGSFLDAPAYQVSAELPADEQAPAHAGRFTGRTLGHYRLLELLGKGGMGEVYLAFDTRLARKVAIKLLPPQFTADVDRVRRFEREAQAASALNHPNILTIHEIGREGDLYFMATELVEGQTLRQRITGGRMKLEEALEVALQVAAALSAAHAAGIVHRDIKPENIMLRPDGYVKVLDFGLAKLTEQTSASQLTDSDAPTRLPLETEPGAIMGTLSYMSPEQTRGQKVDARTDIWSLGVVLYEMTTGQLPFSGPTASDIIVSILDRKPVSLTKHLGRVPPELESMVARALVKDREERYYAIQDLGLELKGLKRRLELEAELGSAASAESSGTEAAAMIEETPSPPSAAPPRTTAEPSRRARSPALIAAAAVLVITLIGLAAWGWLRPQPAAPSPASNTGPERLLSFSLTVQKMRDGKPYQEPFESSGQEIFENGWKFRLNFSSPQAGFLYLLNEGPAAGGVITFHLLFPTPSINAGLAQLAVHQSMQTGWYLFDEHQGTEKFWLVWAAAPVRELEAVRGVVNPQDLGVIREPSQISAVRAFLTAHASAKPEVEKDKVKKQTNLRGRGEILVNLIELEHH
jgi:serine/threonine protein kinase